MKLFQIRTLPKHNPSLKHIIQVFFDIERPSGIVLTEGFVNYRWKFFLDYTYRSLMNQTFMDFEVWLICGWRHRDITEYLHCDDGPLRVIYPVPVDPTLPTIIGDTFTIASAWKKKPTLMIKEFEEQSVDYLAITRIDSDDLFRQDAMAEIDNRTRFYIDQRPKERIRLLFRNYIYWDMINHYLSFQIWESPPFFTHIFPKAIYQDWSRLQQEHFDNHRFMGGGETLILTPNKVLVTYHKQNIARIKRGNPLRVWTERQFREFRKKGFETEFNRVIMNNYLKKFGVYDYER